MGVTCLSSRTFGKPTDNTVLLLSSRESLFFIRVHPRALLLENISRDCGQCTEALVETAGAQDEAEDIWLGTVASEQAE